MSTFMIKSTSTCLASPVTFITEPCFHGQTSVRKVCARQAIPVLVRCSTFCPTSPCHMPPVPWTLLPLSPSVSQGLVSADGSANTRVVTTTTGPALSLSTLGATLSYSKSSSNHVEEPCAYSEGTRPYQTATLMSLYVCPHTQLV